MADLLEENSISELMDDLDTLEMDEVGDGKARGLQYKNCFSADTEKQVQKDAKKSIDQGNECILCRTTLSSAKRTKIHVRQHYITYVCSCGYYTVVRDMVRRHLNIKKHDTEDVFEVDEENWVVVRRSVPGLPKVYPKSKIDVKQRLGVRARTPEKLTKRPYSPITPEPKRLCFASLAADQNQVQTTKNKTDTSTTLQCSITSETIRQGFISKTTISPPSHYDNSDTLSADIRRKQLMKLYLAELTAELDIDIVRLRQRLSKLPQHLNTNSNY